MPLREYVEEGAFSYLFNRTAWGQGYATEALRAMVRCGFEQLALARLADGCDVENIASARVMEKCGFRCVRPIHKLNDPPRHAKERLFFVKLRALRGSLFSWNGLSKPDGERISALTIAEWWEIEQHETF